MIRSYRNNNNPCWRVSASVTTLTYGRGDTSHRAGPGNVPGHCCCLGCSCCLSCCCLLLHLPVTLTQIKHLAGDKTNAKIWWQDNILNEHSTIWLSTNIGRFNVTSTKFINYNMLLHMYMPLPHIRLVTCLSGFVASKPVSEWLVYSWLCLSCVKQAWRLDRLNRGPKNLYLYLTDE